jgi:hypothetical protein
VQPTFEILVIKLAEKAQSATTALTHRRHVKKDFVVLHQKEFTAHQEYVSQMAGTSVTNVITASTHQKPVKRA